LKVATDAALPFLLRRVAERAMMIILGQVTHHFVFDLDLRRASKHSNEGSAVMGVCHSNRNFTAEAAALVSAVLQAIFRIFNFEKPALLQLYELCAALDCIVLYSSTFKCERSLSDLSYFLVSSMTI
jgi:hypothetical protein